MFKEFNDLLKFLFFFVAACNIFKGGGFVALIFIFCFCKIKSFSAALLAHHKEPENSHCTDEKKGGEHGYPPGGFFYRKVIRLHFGCGKTVLFVYYLDIVKENGNVWNKIFQSFALIFSFFGNFGKGKFAGSEIENIAFNFLVFKKLEHFVIFRLNFLFLVHGEHKGGEEKQKDKCRSI